MRTYTNMAWPDDPYRTGQQLYPRPAPRLASFATGPPPARGAQTARSAAIVYLPLHRTRPLTVTGQTLTFGFRAASITGEAEAGALAALADLDLIQARRHAAVLTGCMLGGDSPTCNGRRDHAARPGRGPGRMEQPPHVRPGEGRHVRLPR